MIVKTLTGEIEIKAGMKLEGNEGNGPEVILITAVGEKAFLAKTIRLCGIEVHKRSEAMWTLKYRDWKVVQ